MRLGARDGMMGAVDLITRHTSPLPPDGHTPADRFRHDDPWRDLGPGGRRPPAGGTRWWPWLFAALLTVAALAAVIRFFVFSPTGQLIEYRAFHLVEQRQNAGPGGTAQQLLTIAPIAVELVAGLAVLHALAVRRRWRAATGVVVALVGANVTTQLLKALLERPDFPNGVPYLAGNSLPSGHTTLAASAAVALVLLAAPRWRGVVAFAGAVFTAVIGAAAYLEAWHRPSDMMAACLTTLAWGLLVAPLVQHDVVGTDEHLRASLRPSLWGALLWTFGLLGTAAAVGLLAATVAVADSGAEPGTLALAAGVGLSAGPVPLLWALLASGLRRDRPRRRG